MIRPLLKKAGLDPVFHFLIPSYLLERLYEVTFSAPRPPVGMFEDQRMKHQLEPNMELILLICENVLFIKFVKIKQRHSKIDSVGLKPSNLHILN